jgi:hypothetical protein
MIWSGGSGTICSNRENMDPKLEKSVTPFRYSAKKRWIDSVSMGL